jgi:hypothetical protein
MHWRISNRQAEEYLFAFVGSLQAARSDVPVPSDVALFWPRNFRRQNRVQGDAGSWDARDDVPRLVQFSRQELAVG